MSSCLVGLASYQSPVSWSLISEVQRGRLSSVVTSWQHPSVPAATPRHSLHVLLPWYSCSGPNNIKQEGSGGEAHAATPPTSQQQPVVHLCWINLVSASIINYYLNMVEIFGHQTWRFFTVQLMSDEFTLNPSVTIKYYSVLYLVKAPLAAVPASSFHDATHWFRNVLPFFSTDPLYSCQAG